MKSIVILFSIFLVIGCAETTQLSTPDNATNTARYFQRQFIAPGANFSKYKKVYIKEVVLRDMENAYKYDPTDVKMLADKFHAVLEEKLSPELKIVQSAGLFDAETLVIEPKILMIGTPKRVLNAVTTIMIWMPLTSGSAAFEARLTDGMSGKMLAEISDQKTTSMDLKSLTIGNFQKYEHAEAAFKSWAQLLAEMLHNKREYAH